MRNPLVQIRGVIIMKTMSPDEIRHFLLDTPRTGKVATVREDGRPHVAPVWFTLDGDDIIFTTWETTVKANNIRRDPRVAISIDDEAPPFSFVLIEGKAEILNPTPDEMLRWTTEISGRYMGADLADSYGKRNAVPGELLIRVRSVNIVSKKDMAE
jgi:PPOX class probable F420-dependent enzyme